MTGRPVRFRRLGLGLRVFRELAGLSQATFARSAGIGKCQLNRYERGHELPKLDTLGKLLDALQVTPLAFFYCLALLESRFAPGPGVESQLLVEGGLPVDERHIAALRRLFTHFLDVFQSAIASRMPAAPEHAEAGAGGSASARR